MSFISSVRHKLGSPLLLFNLTNLLLSLHAYLIVYINSDFLTTIFKSDQIVNNLFVLGAGVSVAVLLSISFILRQVDLKWFISFCLTLELLAVLTLGLVSSPYLIMLGFLSYRITFFTLLFLFDIVLEQYSTDESKTGGIRSFYLTVSNTMLVISPFLVGFIVGNEKMYEHAYLISAAVAFPAIILSYFALKSFNSQKIHIGSPLTGLKKLMKVPALRYIFATQFILRCFYAWTVIYVPLYLLNNIGFDWPQLSIIFSIMLLPFVLFEIPAGRIADEYLGEKELLALGFIILTAVIFIIPSMTTTDMMLWAGLLFVSRIGAALVEIMSETFFFKQVNDDDSDVIALFRGSTPATYVIIPPLAGLTITLIGFTNSFYVLAAICALGLLPTLLVKDTLSKREQQRLDTNPVAERLH